MSFGISQDGRPTEELGITVSLETTVGYSTEALHGQGWIKELRKQRIRSSLFGEPELRARLGRYQIRRAVGRGGMGVVLEAYDHELDREVALKLLHLDIAELEARRLRREAEALARLSHPNVVQVYELAEDDGRLFIVMEMIRGQTLQKWQAGRSWRECVDAYLQAGRGLAAAHQRGLVHRDFKPGNCIIDGAGRVRVLDFGLAQESQATTDIDLEPGSESRPRRPPTSTWSPARSLGPGGHVGSRPG